VTNVTQRPPAKGEDHADPKRGEPQVSMKTQFDNPLELSEDRRRITAKGPLEWDPGDNRKCHIAVQITQGNLTGTGHTGNWNHGDHWWHCHVDAPHGEEWDDTADVRCVGTITMSAPPPALPWFPQTVALQLALAPALA
jgi:hypothetical protein